MPPSPPPVLGATLLLFVAAMSVAGVAHQVGLLVTMKEPMTINPWDVAPCSRGRAWATATWLEHWRIQPLDELPTTTSKPTW